MKWQASSQQLEKRHLPCTSHPERAREGSELSCMTLSADFINRLERLAAHRGGDSVAATPASPVLPKRRRRRRSYKLMQTALTPSPCTQGEGWGEGSSSM